MNGRYYEWGALGRVNMRTGKFEWANPDDSYYRAFSFFATAYWDGKRWMRILGRD